MITLNMHARPRTIAHASAAADTPAGPTLTPRPSTAPSAVAPTAPSAVASTAPSVNAPAPPAPARRTGPALVLVRDGLWRVVDRSGAVLGHIEREAQTDGDRYLARRLVMPTRRIELGAFWRMDEAADCFR